MVSQFFCGLEILSNGSPELKQMCVTAGVEGSVLARVWSVGVRLSLLEQGGVLGLQPPD